MAVTGTYDPYVVMLSFAVACLASYTALDLGGRIRVSRRWARLAWLATAAIAVGGGIWSMHFIAMLAFFMPMPVSFDVGLTLLSLGVAIGVTGVGFFCDRHSPDDHGPLRAQRHFHGLRHCRDALHRYGGHAVCQERAQEAVLEGFAVLQKPYDLQTLSEAIRELQSG